MKTVLKILGGLFAALLAAILILYIDWLRPPSAEAVCENIEKLTAEGLPDAARAEVHTKCIKRAGTPPEFGRVPWVTRLKCSRDATDLAALETCSEK